MEPDAMILVFWMLSFKPTFSLSSFTFIKSLFSSSSLSAIRVLSSAYLRLLIFLLAILIPACASTSPAFCMMRSVYKLNKQGNNIQPWHTLFPIWNQSVFPSLALIVASWHAWDLLKEVSIIFITSTIVWSQVNRREGTQLHPSTENWIKDLQRMAPPIRTEPSFPVTLSSGSFHKPLILIHQGADRMKSTITEN